jgi:hypothetical protein
VIKIIIANPCIKPYTNDKFSLTSHFYLRGVRQKIVKFSLPRLEVMFQSKSCQLLDKENLFVFAAVEENLT